jgi:hypothetical protein
MEEKLLDPTRRDTVVSTEEIDINQSYGGGVMDRIDPPDHPIWSEISRRKKVETELATLKTLVRDMGEIVKLLDRFVDEYHGYTNKSLKDDALKARKILSRPEVRAIMEEEL